MTTDAQAPDGEDPRPWVTELERRSRLRQEAYDERVAARVRQVALVTVITGIGIATLLSKGYQLAMTDDYAAVISAAILAVLVIGFVELHGYKKQVTDLVAKSFEDIDNNFKEIKEGMESSSLSPDDFDKGIYAAALEPAMVAQLKGQARDRVAKWWTRLCVMLVVALLLIFVWAAIDGHGPARWLAWYSCCITSIGVAAVLTGALSKGKAEERERERILEREMEKVWASLHPRATPARSPVPPARDGQESIGVDQDPLPGM
ncbi:hypothetical protein ACJ6WF_48485 [Streptomyces sp. MMS24-I2-30]|uniref:hypothetical protein n=1 Tax=Streptomyces sp. MMS24-I2-30 TaxID=3351564 RepID=UPI003896A0F3